MKMKFLMLGVYLLYSNFKFGHMGCWTVDIGDVQGHSYVAHGKSCPHMFRGSVGMPSC